MGLVQYTVRKVLYMIPRYPPRCNGDKYRLELCKANAAWLIGGSDVEGRIEAFLWRVTTQHCKANEKIC